MKLKKYIICFSFCLLGIFLFVILSLTNYVMAQKNNEKMISYCEQNDTTECRSKMFEILLPKILINDVKINGEPIEFIKMDYTARLVSLYAISESDVLLGYGVGDEISYEERYAALFDKTSYAFDCGVPFFAPKNSNCKFYSECIASDKFLIFDHLFTNAMQVSSGKVHTLKQKINELSLKNKKIFIKMDIAEADTVGIPEIIKNADNILGFNVAVYLGNASDIIKRVPLFEQLNEKFVLVSRTILPVSDRVFPFDIESKFYVGGFTNGYMYFSYVNKNIVDDYKISFFQDTENFRKKNKIYGLGEEEPLSFDKISFQVTSIEQLNRFLRGLKNEKASS